MFLWWFCCFACFFGVFLFGMKSFFLRVGSVGGDVCGGGLVVEFAGSLFFFL